MAKKEFVTKDSGQRQDYASGMRRDLQKGKARFDLVLPEGQKYDETLLYRWAMLLERGAVKYGERNWEKANSQEEVNRFKASAMRHFMQWYCGEEDEDHAAAVLFNINCYETIKEKVDKMNSQQNGNGGNNLPVSVTPADIEEETYADELEYPNSNYNKERRKEIHG